MAREVLLKVTPNCKFLLTILTLPRPVFLVHSVNVKPYFIIYCEYISTLWTQSVEDKYKQYNSAKFPNLCTSWSEHSFVVSRPAKSLEISSICQNWPQKFPQCIAFLGNVWLPDTTTLLMRGYTGFYKEQQNKV